MAFWGMPSLYVLICKLVNKLFCILQHGVTFLTFTIHSINHAICCSFRANTFPIPLQVLADNTIVC